MVSFNESTRSVITQAGAGVGESPSGILANLKKCRLSWVAGIAVVLPPFCHSPVPARGDLNPNYLMLSSRSVSVRLRSAA